MMGARTNRRRFLLLGTAGLVGLVASARPAWAQPTLRALPGGPESPLTVGFVASSEEWPELRKLPPTFLAEAVPDAWRQHRFEVVPAPELGLGDQELAGESVRLTVHGLYPPADPEASEGIEGAWLEVLVPDPDPTALAPLVFTPWGLTCHPGVSHGARNSFVVPVSPQGGLELALVVQGAPRSTTLIRRFAAPYLPKLQRGIYLLALRPQAWLQSRRLPLPGEILRPGLRSLVVTVARVERAEREE